MIYIVHFEYLVIMFLMYMLANQFFWLAKNYSNGGRSLRYKMAFMFFMSGNTFVIAIFRYMKNQYEPIGAFLIGTFMILAMLPFFFEVNNK